MNVRIAIVSREVIPFFGAGIGTYAAAMARAWRANGHEVHFLSETHRGFEERGPAELGGATCHVIAPRGDGFAFVRHAEGVRQKLIELHTRGPFDYIECPDYWAEGYWAIRGARLNRELAGAVLGVRLHTPTHECRVLNEEGPGGEEVATLERCEDAAIRSADVVISPSRSLLAMVKERLNPQGPGVVVPYPFEVDRIASTPGGAEVVQRPTVLYFGRLERRKGVDLLVDAGQRVLEHGVDVAFRFIGGDTKTGPRGGSMLEHVQRGVAAKWKDRFTFETRKPRHDLFAAVRGVKAAGGVCCFPSRWENYPNVCLEAMSLGAAVVGSDAGGMSEMIEDRVSGMLFRSGDAGHLATVLERVLGDASLRRCIEVAAPGRVANIAHPQTIVKEMQHAIETARRSPLWQSDRGFDEVPMPSVVNAASKSWVLRLRGVLSRIKSP